MKSNYPFPLELIRQNSRVVIYGAGNIGREICSEIIKNNYCKIVLWLDRNADGFLINKPESIERLKVDDYDFVIIAIKDNVIANAVKRKLVDFGVLENKIIYDINKTLLCVDNLRNTILLDFQCKINLNDIDIKELFKSSIKNNLHFSAQVAQDIIAYLFFEGKPEGFYIDIGANDGISGSTTYWAEQIGWKGICIEPQKLAFEKMKEVRNCALYNCAISNKTQESVEFISFPNKDTRSGLANSMSESHIEAAKEFSNIERNFVSTKTFSDIMADFPYVKFIDFLSIDTEGHEMQVLESIDFDKYEFGLMAVETEDCSDVVNFIESKGYKKLMIAGSDVIFVPKDYTIPISCAIYPFKCDNEYINLMKNALQEINIKPIPYECYKCADFIWLHWFENIAEEKDYLSKRDFLKYCKENNKKIIWNLHNKMPHETKDIKNATDFMKYLAEIAYKIVIHCQDSIKLIENLCDNKINILNKVVYLPLPNYADVYGSEKSEHSLQNSKLSLCFFGFIKKYKNIELLISAIKELNFDDVELRIYGNGKSEYLEYLSNLVDENCNIKMYFRFISDEEIPEILANSHLIILPYNLDSSLNSSATILAFSYARSVISSLTGTLNDINDKSMFFAYNYNSQEEHKEKLKEQIVAIREKYKGNYNELLSLGQKCKEYVLEYNSYSKVAQALSEVFQEL